jgi:hypothetical protein
MKEPLPHHAENQRLAAGPGTASNLAKALCNFGHCPTTSFLFRRKNTKVNKPASFVDSLPVI